MEDGRDGRRPFGDEIGRKIWGRKIGNHEWHEWGEREEALNDEC
jgi:Fe-S cluster biosynthesis and repair protein YggX